MNVCDLDGYEHVWKPSCRRKNKCSGLHRRARDLLSEMFPCTLVMEEVSIKVRRRNTLYLDFYIPIFRAVIEVHGQQHYKMSTLYHKSQMDFLKGRRRDADKRYWCELNNLIFIELPYNEVYNEWNNRIQDSIRTNGDDA